MLQDWLWGWQQVRFWAPAWMVAWGLPLGLGALLDALTRRLGGRGLSWAWGWVGAGLFAWGMRQTPWPWRSVVGWGLTIGGFWAALWAWLYGPRRQRPLLLSLALLAGIAGPWSLAGMARLRLPPYQDGAVHMALLQARFLGRPVDVSPQGVPLPWGGGRFYHLGWHGWLAWVFWLLPTTPPLALTVLSWTLLYALWPWLVGRYLLARGHSPWAAAAGALGAPVVWAMPLYGLHWSKGPLLLGLSLALLAWPRPWNRAGTATRGFWPLLVWVHARLVLWVGLWHLVAVMAEGADRVLPNRLRSRGKISLGSGLALANLALAAWLMTRGLYWRWYMPSAALLLLVSALWAWVQPAGPPRDALSALLLLQGLALLPRLRGWSGVSAWCDRPTFEILAVLPLALLLGVATAACLDHCHLRVWQKGAGVILLLLLAWQHAYRPNPAVIIATDDDLEAMAFLEHALGPGALVLTGARRAADYARQPVDAGVWLPPLLDVTVRPTPEAAWWEPWLLRPLCAQYGQVWAYVDLDPPGLALPPERPWLRLRIFTPTVHIYRVLCSALRSGQSR